MNKNISSIIKALRIQGKMSQRKLAKLSKVSFPQIQRIEKGSSNATVRTLNKLLNVFNKKIEVCSIEPRWEYLTYFGFALSIKPKKCNISLFENELVKAHFFLMEHYYNSNFQRHIDAYKSFLLTLYSHYRKHFRLLEEKLDEDLKQCWNILLYKGKHIKLRNITLNIFSKRIKNG